MNKIEIKKSLLSSFKIKTIVISHENSSLIDEVFMVMLLNSVSFIWEVKIISDIRSRDTTPKEISMSGTHSLLSFFNYLNSLKVHKHLGRKLNTENILGSLLGTRELILRELVGDYGEDNLDLAVNLCLNYLIGKDLERFDSVLEPIMELARTSRMQPEEFIKLLYDSAKELNKELKTL